MLFLPHILSQLSGSVTVTTAPSSMGNYCRFSIVVMHEGVKCSFSNHMPSALPETPPLHSWHRQDKACSNHCPHRCSKGDHWEKGILSIASLVAPSLTTRTFAFTARCASCLPARASQSKNSALLVAEPVCRSDPRGLRERQCCFTPLKNKFLITSLALSSSATISVTSIAQVVKTNLSFKWIKQIIKNEDNSVYKLLFTASIDLSN